MALPWNSLLHTQNFAGYLTRAAMPPTTASSIETPSDMPAFAALQPTLPRPAKLATALPGTRHPAPGTRLSVYYIPSKYRLPRVAYQPSSRGTWGPSVVARI